MPQVPSGPLRSQNLPYVTEFLPSSFEEARGPGEQEQQEGSQGQGRGGEEEGSWGWGWGGEEEGVTGVGAGWGGGGVTGAGAGCGHKGGGGVGMQTGRRHKLRPFHSLSLICHSPTKPSLLGQVGAPDRPPPVVGMVCTSVNMHCEIKVRKTLGYTNGRKKINFPILPLQVMS